jgi:hypothetical protein
MKFLPVSSLPYMKHLKNSLNSVLRKNRLNKTFVITKKETDLAKSNKKPLVA